MQTIKQTLISNFCVTLAGLDVSCCNYGYQSLLYDKFTATGKSLSDFTIGEMLDLIVEADDEFNDYWSVILD